MSSVQFHDMIGDAAHIIEMEPEPVTFPKPVSPDPSIASDAAHPDVQTPPVPLPAGTSTRDLNSAKATTLAISAFKTPKNNLVIIIKAGLAKAQLSVLHIFLLGVMAGMYVSVGALVMTIITGGLSGDQVWSSSSSTVTLDSTTNHSITTTTSTTTHYSLPAGFVRLIQAGVFPLALIPVILAGAELFTSNVMFGLASWYARKTTWRQMLRHWGVSYLGNFIGCVLFGFLLVYLTDLTSTNPIKSWLQNLVYSKTHQGWGIMALKGIGCNILVCLAVWQALVAEDVIGKIVGIWWPIFGFVAIGFEHSIANMFLAPLALMTGLNVNFGDFLAWNLIPVLHMLYSTFVHAVLNVRIWSKNKFVENLNDTSSMLIGVVTLGNIIGGGFFITIQWFVFQEHLHKQIEPLTVKAGYKAPSHVSLAWLAQIMHLNARKYTQPQPAPISRESTKLS